MGGVEKQKEKKEKGEEKKEKEEWRGGEVEDKEATSSWSEISAAAAASFMRSNVSGFK